MSSPQRPALDLEQSYRLLAALVRSERHHEAEQLARSLVEQEPERADRYVALGRVLAKQDRFSEAIGAYRRALELEPRSVTVTTPLVEALAVLGRVDDSIAELERALAVEPSLVAEGSSLAFQTLFSAHHDAQSQLAVARRWSERHAAPLIAKRQPYPHDRNPERRLRVGYVSPDFRRHVQRLYTLPVLAQHDHSAYEIVAYSSVKAADEYTERIRALTDEWHDVARLSDAALAQKIRDDRIDVLVDLTQHMVRGRLRTFAEKPAPVQLSWLAYPGTTGVDGIDYRLTDPHLDPPGAPLPYSERTLRLPHTFWCYGPDATEGVVGSLPFLRNGFVTFGCLNNFMKVSPPTLELWAKVLQANPTARLLMLAPADAVAETLRVFAANGVASPRIDFVDYQSRERYLDTYNRIDIALDTLPYNGHTTSLDAYWMGVPVVTLVGETVVGRAGLSLANNLELSAWIARTADDFVAIATRFAADPEELTALRGSLRRRLQSSPLMDARRFTRDLEGVYREAWQRFCATAARA